MVNYLCLFAQEFVDFRIQVSVLALIMFKTILNILICGCFLGEVYFPSPYETQQIFCFNISYISRWKHVKGILRDRLQILLPILNEITNFYSPLIHQKTVGFLMLAGGIEVN